jgi:hypothetical protein
VERRWNERPIDTPILIVLCLALESPIVFNFNYLAFS